MTFSTGNVKGSDHCFIATFVKYLAEVKHTAQVVLVKLLVSIGA